MRKLFSGSFRRPTKPRSDRDRHRWSVYDGIAPPLILLAPLIVFLDHAHYPLLTPEALLLCAGFAVVGGALGLAAGAAGRVPRSLLTAFVVIIFVDVQFDVLNSWKVLAGFVVLSVLTWLLDDLAPRILSAAFASIIVSTLLLSASERAPGDPADARPADAAATVTSDLPVLIHLVLDEHIGTEGLPPELERASQVKEKLISFYLSNGFRLFGNAYSQYFQTELSLSHMMNFLSDLQQEDIVSKDPTYAYKMLQNTYTGQLRQQGFRTRIYQTTWLNICVEDQMNAEVCQAAEFIDLGSVSRSSISLVQKIRVILSVYADLSYLHTRIMKLNRDVRSFVEFHGISVPNIAWQRYARGQFAAMELLERMRRQAAIAMPGDALIVHLLLPHHPYLYDPNCNPRELDDWLDSGSENAPLGMINTQETRLRRYEVYLQQVECTTARLAVIFDIMRESETYRDAIIVVQGDHGSRIGQIAPSIESIDRMSDSDFRDFFSTLFAVKAPGIDPGYDVSARSIQELLSSLMANDFNAVPDRDKEPGGVFVGDGQGNYARYPLRGFDRDEP